MLPARVPFESRPLAGESYWAKPQLSAYRVLGRRPPRKGEYYLSGAVPFAYIAPNDLSTPYLIVERVADKPCPTCGHIKGVDHE